MLITNNDDLKTDNYPGVKVSSRGQVKRFALIGCVIRSRLSPRVKR